MYEAEQWVSGWGEYYLQILIIIVGILLIVIILMSVWWNMKQRICERCGKEYRRGEDEIVVFPNVCKECDIFLSNKDLVKE
jgi:hypothetical protein